MSWILGFARTLLLYCKTFGFLKTLLKCSSYEFIRIDRLLRDKELVVDFMSREGLLSALLQTKIKGVTIFCVEERKEYLEFLNREKTRLKINPIASSEPTHISGADAYILNDTFHHLPKSSRNKLIKEMYENLESNGIILIRDVAKGLNLDFLLTNWIDQRLYPSDSINFLTIEDWENLIREVSPRKFQLKRGYFGWPSNKLQIVMWK